MPKGIPNKRYTPEYKKLVIETMLAEKQMSTHLPLATSAASIGKGYPFRKNPRFDAMRRTGIFSCWDSPKPFYIPSLNIPFERRFLLHFAPRYIQHRIFNFPKQKAAKFLWRSKAGRIFQS